MSKSVRKADLNTQIERLQRRHHQLKARVAELDSRLSLSPKEQFLVAELKKKKLATKDELQDLMG